MTSEYSESNSLQKEERLHHKSLIQALFDKGHTFRLSPLRVLWREEKLPSHSPVQVLVTVSQKRFPKAVTRNRIKRKMREAYRTQKHPLYSFFEEKGTQCAVGLVYIKHKEVSYPTIQKTTKQAISRLIDEYEKMDR